MNLGTERKDSAQKDLRGQNTMLEVIKHQIETVKMPKPAPLTRRE
jgi:hypothetical protein